MVVNGVRRVGVLLASPKTVNGKTIWKAQMQRPEWPECTLVGRLTLQGDAIQAHCLVFGARNIIHLGVKHRGRRECIEGVPLALLLDRIAQLGEGGGSKG